MAESIILALIIAKFKGYQIKELFKLKEFYVILFMEALILIVQVNIFLGNYWIIKFAAILKTIYLCSYLPLVFKTKCYKQTLIGAGCVLGGGILNDIAIKANNGFMPVFPSFSKFTGYCTMDAFEKVNDLHIMGTDDVKLKFLTDIFDVGYSVLSIGDIFMRVFVVIIIYSSVKNINLYLKNSAAGDDIKC